MSSPSAIGGYAQVFATVLENLGIDYKAVFDEAGVTFTERNDPLSRISTAQVSRLFEISVRLTKNPYLGLEVGHAFQPGHLHALGYGLLSSNSLRDFFQRIEKYYRVVSQSAEFSHFVEGGAAILCASHISELACPESQDAWGAGMLRLMRMVYQRPLNPLYIQLTHECPAAGDQPYTEYFNCPVAFGCESARIALDDSIIDQRLPAASEELARHHDRILMDYQEKLDKADTVTRVRRLIVRDLSSGVLVKDAIAQELSMSTRSMQMKLAAESTSFQEILDDCRLDLAKGYMAQHHISITEVAYLLGFADASNFTRAFRRWTGLSPSQYRAGLS